MFPFIPSFLLLLLVLLVLLLAAPALLTPATLNQLQVRGQRTARDAKQDSIKVLISEDWATRGDSSDGSQRGKEIDLSPGSPLVLTHRIRLVPGSGSGSGPCGCGPDFAALRGRLERLEREVSTLREKCGGEGGCCSSKESKGAGCSIKPEVDQCPNRCSDHGRCAGARCACDPGFTGPDCSEADCPGNCSSRGRCVSGRCVCDPGSSGPDCSQASCPGNCSSRGRCVNGKCACAGGFTGPSCSDESCPGKCNRRGRCVSGRCVCDDGFAGDDCADRSCPGDCNRRGRCVSGRCACDPGFAGPDCSQASCPGHCSSRGRCADGECVCDVGFVGADCSGTACPGDCGGRGECVSGKCVCDVGFAGPDCGARGCPGDCGGEGRCVTGSCVCRRGFAGPACSRCEDGLTGPDCDTVMSGVSQLTTKDITETSVTLRWTPPGVQYESYSITFTSKKDRDQQVGVQVEGGRTGFTQTGLAAGQDYTVTVTGETGGRQGAESAAEFTTLISGPADLRVVKTTSTSAVVQWERSQGEIDRYRLTVTPSDGEGRSQEMAVPAGRDSAHIRQLEAGRLYDVALVAEKGTSRSAPATTQVTPGTTLPRVSTAAFTLAPGRDVGGGRREVNPSAEVSHQQGRREDGSQEVNVGVTDGPHTRRDSATAATARTKPLVGKKMGINGAAPKVPERSSASYGKAKVSGPFRSNTTRVAWRQFGPGPLKRPPVAQKKKKAPVVPKKPKPGVPAIGVGTISLTRSEPALEASSAERRVDENPAPASGNDSDTNRQRSSGEPTEEQPDVGEAVGRGTDNGPVSSQPTGAAGSQEKKCMNKVKVTHVRFPHRGRGAGPAPVEKTPGSDQGSSEVDDLKPSSVETDLDHSPDPLLKLLTDTFDSLNTSTFSVHLSEPSNVPVDAETARKQILKGLRPLSPSSPWSSSSSTSRGSSSSARTSSSSTSRSSSSARTSSSSSSSSSSPSLGPSSPTAAPSPPRSPSHSSGEPSSSSSSLPSSPSSLASPSLAPSSSAAASSSSSLTLSMSSPSSLPSPQSSSQPSSLPSPQSSSPQSSSSPSTPSPSTPSPSTPSPSLSSSDKSGSVRSSEPDVDNRKSATDVSSPEDRKPPPSGPLFQRTPAKHGYVRRLRPNFGLYSNKTRLNLRVPHRPTPRLNLVPKRESETRHTSTSELSSSPSSSASLPESSVEVSAPVRGTSGEEDGATPTASTGVEHNQKKKPTEGGRIPVRRLPPKGGYLLRRPNFEALQNRTRPNLRVLPPPSRPLNPVSATRRKQLSSTELPATSSSSPVSKESYPAKGTGPIVAENVDRVGTRMSSIRMSTEFNRTLRGRGVPSSHRPFNKVDYLRRLQLYGGRFQNKTHTNLRPPQHPQKGPVRKLFPNKKLNGSSTIGGQTLQLENDNSPENQTGGQMLTQGVQIGRSGEQDSAEVIPHSQMDGRDTTVRPQINKLERWNDALIQTTKSGEETTSTPASNSDSDSHKERVNTGATSRGGPTVKQTSSDSRREAPRPPTRGTTAQRQAQIRHYSGGRKRTEETKTNTAAKSVGSKPPAGSAGPSSGIAREPLDHVGVTNRTSTGFKLQWDSPEDKYKHFVVTSRDVRKEEEEGGNEEVEEEKHHPTKETESENGRSEDGNRVPESASTRGPASQSNARVPVPGSDKTLKKVLPGSARSFQFESLPPQTEYTVTLLGKGPGLLSRLHKLVISTGPEPPTDIVFSDVTDSSLTVSWTKPKTPTSGFKVTYTHTEEGEPVSVSVDSGASSLGLSTLSPGSSYEVSVVSVLGLDESDPIKELVVTLPDPPTDLRVVNITDTKALLLWRPALAAVDKYTIVYGAGTDLELRVSVSRDSAEQQLSGLEPSTTYRVTVSSQQGAAEEAGASTTFTTRGPGGPRDLQAHDVTPRTALLSWKPPLDPASSYRLTYQGEGQEMKEVALAGSVAQHQLTGLQPGLRYAVRLRAEGGASGAVATEIATEITTGPLLFPFPSDCSQELLNGVRTSGELQVFPRGKLGTPISVSCDMETDGGGWTVFQRRTDGSVDFFRGWKDYSDGFGNLSGEFWLGLENLYSLTSMTRMVLRVDLRDKDEAAFAKYSKFELVKRNYKLVVGGYSGTAGDSLSYHSDRVFSTRDRDPSPFITRCAMSYRGGWWYKNCHEANLNGAYGTDSHHQGVIWTAWRGTQYSIPFTEMKMRPAAFSPPARG